MRLNDENLGMLGAWGLRDLANLTAADVMTPDPVVVREGDSLASAWEILARSRFHHLPVLRGSHCIGLVDDRAIVRALRPGNTAGHRVVGDVLVRRHLEVPPGVALVEVARLLRAEDVDAVPVVDSTGALVGVVTATDLVAVLAGPAVNGGLQTGG